MVQVRALGAYLPSLIPENGEKGAVVKCYSTMDRKGRKIAKSMEIIMRVDLGHRMRCAKEEVSSITYQATAIKRAMNSRANESERFRGAIL